MQFKKIIPLKLKLSDLFSKQEGMGVTHGEAGQEEVPVVTAQSPPVQYKKENLCHLPCHRKELERL